MKTQSWGLLDEWNSHPDHMAMSMIYEKEVPKVSIDVNQVLNEYVGGTTGGRVSYGNDLSQCRSNGQVIQG